MIEALVIDPFDSDHFLYGTGATIYGSHDLTNWDTEGTFLLESLADGVEETAVQSLLAPPSASGPILLSAVGDIEGFIHVSLTSPPAQEFMTPEWTTTADLDYAGNEPTNMVRIGADSGSALQQVAVSTNSGVDWNTDFGAALNVTGGKVAYSANADTVLWSSSTNGVLVSQFTNAFVAVPSLPSGSIIASDKRNDDLFYAASGNSFYLSTNIGKSFTAISTLGGSTAPVKIVVHPNVTGDVWVSSDKGLFHSTNNGTTFTAISGITEAWAIALGAPQTAGAYPSVFAAAEISGVVGYFRSDNEGTSWVQIDDVNHRFAAINSNPVTADLNVWGRVFIGTNGRGIFYGVPAGSTPPPVSASSTSKTSTISSTTSKTSTISSTTSKTSTISISSTISSTSTITATTTSASSTSTSGLAGAFGQCGGTGWTGATACVSGFTCVVQNPFFSQCVQS